MKIGCKTFSMVTLSPCERSRKGGRKFNLKKKSTNTRIWCHRICLSVCLSVTNFDLNYKKVCNFGCHSSFCNPVFASKTVIFRISFLAGNNYPDSHHSQGGIKFAPQISPLLNYNYTECAPFLLSSLDLFCVKRSLLL